jgi:squalene-associated FAD-dependent desaturase
MKPRSVCIIGGGFAGLSAAVFLSQHNQFEVTLIEASPGLGGRAYSFFDKTINQYVDNGQHIFAGWYKHSFDFLKIIGSFDKLKFQKSLDVKFVEPGGKTTTVKTSGLSSLSGFFNTGQFTFKDITAVMNLISSIKLNRFSNDELKKITISDLLEKTKQTAKLIKYFWNPLVIAVFNTSSEQASAWQFVNIIKAGFSANGGASLVLPKTNLDGLYITPAIKYLNDNHVKVITSARVKNLKLPDDKVKSIVFDNGEESVYDYYISAVSFYDFKSLIGAEIFDIEFKFVEKLQPSPIINIHYWFEGDGLKDIITDDFLGVIGTNIQWIFKQSESHLCLVISGAEKLVEMKNEEILDISRKELYDCLLEISKLKIIHTKAIKEKRATFLPSPESNNARPQNSTRYANFFITGDWTDTGLPASIESAVISSRRCVEKVVMRVNQ